MLQCEDFVDVNKTGQQCLYAFVFVSLFKSV